MKSLIASTAHSRPDPDPRTIGLPQARKAGHYRGITLKAGRTINNTSPLAEANDYGTKLQRAKRLRYDALSRYVLGKLPKADLTEW